MDIWVFLFPDQSEKLINFIAFEKFIFFYIYFWFLFFFGLVFPFFTQACFSLFSFKYESLGHH